MEACDRKLSELLRLCSSDGVLCAPLAILRVIKTKYNGYTAIRRDLTVNLLEHHRAEIDREGEILGHQQSLLTRIHGKSKHNI